MVSRSSICKGFTLIELVIVIVILGVLAVVAAPNFIDLSKQAKISNLHAIAGEMRSGLGFVHAKAATANKATGSQQLVINGTNVSLYNGYPAVDGSDSFPETNVQLKVWLDLDVVDRNTARDDRDSAVFFSDKWSAMNYIYVFFTEDYDSKSVSFRCHVRYANPPTPSPTIPVVVVLTEDC